MKKIAVIITVIAMVSCTKKVMEIPKAAAPHDMVNEAAVPYIARQLDALDNNILIARDTTQNTIYRNIAIDNIRRDGVEYLNTTTIDNIFSPDFEERLENQKKLIIINCRQTERNKQYTQLVTEQFEK